MSYEKQIFTLEKELYESQLEFNYLTSPKILSKNCLFKQRSISKHGYFEHLLDYKTFIWIKKNLLKIIYENEKPKNLNKNQQSFSLKTI